MAKTVEARGRLLSVEQVADMLGLKEVTIRAWILQRKVPHVKIGRTVRIRSEAIEEMLTVVPALERKTAAR